MILTDQVSPDVVLAYRKAKADLFRATDQRVFDLDDYESNLHANLLSLEDRILGIDEDWCTTREFIGTYEFIPYGISGHERRAEGFIQSSPSDSWRGQYSHERRADALFRTYSRCSIDFHVLASLWMIRVGSKMEARLGHEAYGNRVRRTKSGALNELAVGTFDHYPSAYGRWRDEGLDSMRKSLVDGVPITTLTADVSAFYHCLNPKFLIDSAYLNEVLKINLSAEEARLNHLFVSALQAWSRTTAEALGVSVAGIPVGLPASAVVANLALIELDDIARSEFGSIYYGRYVDDIILVVQATGKIHSQEDLWRWISLRSRGRIVLHEIDTEGKYGADIGTETYASFEAPYLHGSVIRFSSGKSRVFNLAVDTGLEMIDEIRRNISERASALRSFTDLSDDVEAAAGQISRIVRKDGDGTFDLRDADGLAIRRSAFAARLRDMETYERDLPASNWRAQRSAFFEAIGRHVMVLPHFLSFAEYYPRLLKIAAASGDWDCVEILARGLGAVKRAVRDTCSCDLKIINELRGDGVEGTYVYERWAATVTRVFVESLASSLEHDISDDKIRTLIKLIGEEDDPNVAYVKFEEINRRRKLLHERDLAHRAFRRTLLRRGKVDYVSDLVVVPKEVERDSAVAVAARHLCNIAGLPDSFSSHSGVLFPTRPANRWELFEAIRWDQGQFEKGESGDFLEVIESILHGFRGVPKKGQPVSIEADETRAVFRVASKRKGDCVKIALVTMKTEIECWKAAALGKSLTGADRYSQFRAVFREALARPERPDYILLPECAMPAAWFASFANRLNRSGISLVSGVEYLSPAKRLVHNQVWMSLSVGLAYDGSSVLYRQDKQVPAHREATNLMNLDEIVMKPEVEWEVPPIVSHGDFKFATLICSELTNISNRSSLRGKVDALFVLEWNSDLHTFDALVNSAALDIHAYVAQVNHRDYGDSRIRSPRAIDHERDVIQVRGGMHDHVLVGMIDYGALRRHQSAHNVINGRFKPIPAGFVISPERRRLPAMGKE